MKKSTTLFLFCFMALFTQAQWSNTTNQFYDSLHMPVVTATGTQQNEIIVKSYPDSGYFVVWEDSRTSGNQADIYAQKYDKNGNTLWASNGVPVAATTYNELLSVFPFGSPDYRYAGHTCTDSAGGFYIVWDANPGNFGDRIRAQHVLPDGSHRFADSGFDVRTGNENIYFYNPQLIADGRKGFFLSFVEDNRFGGITDLYVYDYREDGDSLVSLGGGQADVYGEEKVTPTQCFNHTEVVYPNLVISDYNLYPDGQGGCNVVFDYYVGSTYDNRTHYGTGFNQLCRVKKESDVTVRRRSGDVSGDVANSTVFNYTLKKDSVVMLYNFRTYNETKLCVGVTVSNQYIENGGEGFLTVFDTTDANSEYAKGTVATTDGAANINANIIAASITGSGTSYKRMFVHPQEIYDSIPYQLSTDTTHPYEAYKPSPDVPLNAINDYSGDTLLAAGGADDEFVLASSNNRIFASGRVSQPGNSALPYSVYLAQLQVDRITSDSFAVRFHTPKGGIVIGKEYYSSPGISYRHPFIATDERGNALFSIENNDKLIQVSPIADSGRLTWGAMGKPIGSGYAGTGGYSTYTPYVLMDPSGGTAVIAWTDTRQVGTASTAFNIFARHLDSLAYYDYQPPQRGAASLPGGNYANTITLSGHSHVWNYIEAYTFTTGITSTVAAVYDTYNLGAVTAATFDQTDEDGNSIRRYSDVPYLDRNYTVNVENNPNGSAPIDIRLYFTNAQFLALQKADPTITSPGDLVVIKQPKGTASIPTTYSPDPDEELITPTAWAAVDGGYYVQLTVSSFSYFFIEKGNGVVPVKWVNVSAERQNGNTALVSWTVANEVNVKNYLVQYSEDGVHYKDGCVVTANGAVTYHCNLAITGSQYFVKIKETDLDGRTGYSNTAVIEALKEGILFIVSPNPVRSDAVLRYTVPATAKASLRLVAANGATVWQQSTTLSQSGTLSIPMKGLPAGAYGLQISMGNKTQVIKIIKE